MDDEFKIRLISGLRWAVLSKILTQALTWVITFIVFRILTPADYGLVAMVSAITALLSMVSELGFGAALIQSNNLTKRQIGAIYGFSLSLNSIITTTLYLNASLISEFYSDPRLEKIIQIYSLQFIISAIAIVGDSMLRREMRFKLVATIDTVSAISASLCTLTLAYFEFSYWSLIFGNLFGISVRTIAIQFLSKYWVYPNFNFKESFSLLAFSSQTAGSRFLSFAFSQADVLIGGRFLSKDALGVYSVAMHLATLPMSKILPIANEILYPSVSNLNREGTYNSEYTLRTLALTSYLLTPLLWGLASVSPILVPLLLGDKWTDAVTPLQIVCIALPIRAVGILISTFISALGRPDINLKAAVTGAVLLIPGFIIGANYGPIGLATSWLIILPFMVYINISRAKDVLKFKLFDLIIRLKHSLIGSAIMYFIVSGLITGLQEHANHTLILLTSVIAGALFYTLWIRTFDNNAFSTIILLIRNKQPSIVSK